MLVGFGIGALAAALPLALLITNQGRSQTPGRLPSSPSDPSTVLTAVDVPQHATGRPLAADARERVAALRERIERDASDLPARKELAVVFMGNAQLLPAFEQASEIMRVDPEDPDALYIHGVVRLRMGQGGRAIRLLDQLLARYPRHVPALVARGKAQRRIGDEAGAHRSWLQALSAAGGHHAEVERLLEG